MTWEIFWTVLAIILAIIEAATLGLTTIWFTAGAVVALIAAWLGANYFIQIFLFFFSSIIFLLLTRPLVVKYFKVGSVKTNVDSLIGKHGIVVEDISEFKYGQVKISGQIWTAKEINGIELKKGTEVKVTSIEGVKLLVEQN